MSKRQRYYKLKYYLPELYKLKQYKQDFETVSTTYTKKIITKDETMFFNEEGKDDKKALLLINAVRNDAKKFLEKNTVSKVNNYKTDFFNLLDVIKSDKVIKKIDFKSAYWTYALKTGVITEATNINFNKWYEGVDVFYAKQARLKALGSLATTKFTNIYENGLWIQSLPVYTEPTKPLYMSVCNGIDNLMKDINYAINGCVYYYWDCMFVEEEFEQEVIEYVRRRGYDVGVEETKLEFVTVGDIGYLLSITDGKIYMTKKENKYLLMPENELEFY